MGPVATINKQLLTLSVTYTPDIAKTSLPVANFKIYLGGILRKAAVFESSVVSLESLYVK